MKLRFKAMPSFFYLFVLVVLIFYVLNEVEEKINPFWFDLQTLDTVRQLAIGN